MKKKSEELIVTLPSDREISMVRAFAAPRALVYAAWTKPELVGRWMYGPDDWRLHSCDMDVRVGGKLRWVWKNAHTGAEMGVNGVYREIVVPERIVHTELFDEDWTGGETIVTTEFTERAGRTTVAMTILYSSRSARDGAAKSGMEEGMVACYNRLDGILESMDREHGA